MVVSMIENIWWDLYAHSMSTAARPQESLLNDNAQATIHPATYHLVFNAYYLIFIV